MELKDKPAHTKQEAPSVKRQRAKLDNWTWHAATRELTGTVFDHPRLTDGEFVRTSTVTWIDRRMKIAETRNTVYILLRRAN